MVFHKAKAETTQSSSRFGIPASEDPTWSFPWPFRPLASPGLNVDPGKAGGCCRSRLPFQPDVQDCLVTGKWDLEVHPGQHLEIKVKEGAGGKVVWVWGKPRKVSPATSSL